MITFKDIMETKNQIKDAWDYKEKIINTEASFDYMDTINTKTAEQMNSLIGRFFNQPKKACVHIWERKSKYGGNNLNKVELQISKSGIGATSSNNCRIDTYKNLFDDDSYYDSKGLIGDVIDDKEVYDKAFKNLSPKGQDVLKILKEARELSNIRHPKTTAIKYPLKLSEEEQNSFGIVNQSTMPIKEHAYIELKDDYKEMVVVVKSKHAQDTEQNEREEVIFKINSLDINDEKDFQYFLFIHYHLNEFEDALKQYIEKTKEHKERWTKFKEYMNEKIAKYVILYKM